MDLSNSLYNSNYNPNFVNPENWFLMTIYFQLKFTKF